MITIEHLSFSYSGLQPYILQDINIEVMEGDYISFIGENGCGKTTLMRILLGFLKPTQGSINIQTKYIGYVPQKKDFNNTNFPITVYEVMNSYRKLLKIKDKNIIMDSLKSVSMDKFKDSLIGDLSGGQTQKIFLARAMMGKPRLLILDEPSTGVDLDSQKEIYEILKTMSIKEKITVITVEHNMEAVFRNSTKVFHLKDGHGHLCNPAQYTDEFLPMERRNDHASL